MRFNRFLLWGVFQQGEEAGIYLAPFIARQSFVGVFCQSQYFGLHPSQGLREWGKPLIFQKIQEAESQKLTEILNTGIN